MTNSKIQTNENSLIEEISLRGRRWKGKGKGILGARKGGGGDGPGFPSSLLPRPRSCAQIPYPYKRLPRGLRERFNPRNFVCQIIVKEITLDFCFKKE